MTIYNSAGEKIEVTRTLEQDVPLAAAMAELQRYAEAVAVADAAYEEGETPEEKHDAYKSVMEDWRREVLAH